MQAKAKAKLATSTSIAAVSNQTTSTTSIPSSSVPAVVTSAITTQPMHSGPAGGIHPGSIQTVAPSNPQQQSQPQPHNIVAPHIPILMDPLVQSNYLISI